jgi:hypothetical protein
MLIYQPIPPSHKHADLSTTARTQIKQKEKEIRLLILGLDGFQHSNLAISGLQSQFVGCWRSKVDSSLLAQLFRTNRWCFVGRGLCGCQTLGAVQTRIAPIAAAGAIGGSFAFNFCQQARRRWGSYIVTDCGNIGA